MPDWSTTAFVFPGQGSQVVGMGKDLAAAYPAAAQTFAEADERLGFSLSRLCFEGPAAELDDTVNTQPALFVTGIATLRALLSALNDVRPAYVAGHSLGELTALTACGALSFADGLRLVRERGRLMKEAGRQNSGAMAAILGLDVVAVGRVCQQASAAVGAPLVVANDNCPGQLVISGDERAVDYALPLMQEAGAKRAIKLAVSVASHSPLMASASVAFRVALDATVFSRPSVPIVGNVNVAPLADEAAIREELGAQLTSPVRWTESIQTLRMAGLQTFVELGPKDVLTGLLKRIDRAATGIPLNSAAQVERFLAGIASA